MSYATCDRCGERYESTDFSFESRLSPCCAASMSVDDDDVIGTLRFSSEFDGMGVTITATTLIERQCQHCNETLILIDKPHELIHCTRCGKANVVKH